MSQSAHDHLYARVGLALAAVAFLATACASQPSPTARPSPTPIPSGLTIFFPQQRPVEGERMRMTALLFGELVEVEGCLRVNDSVPPSVSYLLVWPPDYVLSAGSDAIQILNGAGQVVARVGDEIQLGGGEVPAAMAATYTDQPLPGECPGPYWIVGDVE